MLHEAAGSGGEVEAPGNTNYTKHEAPWGSGAAAAFQGLLHVSQPSYHTLQHAPTLDSR